MEMKAISPVVAVVLLISVTLSLGVVVTSWIRNWILKETINPQISCVLETNYVIDSVTYSTDTNELKIKITNKGTTELYGFGVMLQNATIIQEFNSSNPLVSISPNITVINKLGREKSAYIKINLSDYIPLALSLTEVKVLNDACDAVSASTTSITRL